MGLFDEISVELPIVGVRPFKAQTKELECYQREYRIDESGVLFRKTHDTRPCTPDEAAKLRASDAGAMWHDIWISNGVEINERWEPQNDTALLDLASDEGHRVLIILVDGQVRDVIVKPRAKLEVQDGREA